jgi:hypothetical protein
MGGFSSEPSGFQVSAVERFKTRKLSSLPVRTTPTSLFAYTEILNAISSAINQIIYIRVTELLKRRSQPDLSANHTTWVGGIMIEI